MYGEPFEHLLHILDIKHKNALLVGHFDVPVHINQSINKL